MIMENKTALQIDDRNISEEEAGFYRYEKVLEFVKKLGQALEKKDLNKIIEVFQDRIAIRSMMILRGKYDQYLQLIVDSFILLLQKHDIELMPKQKIKDFLYFSEEFLKENNLHDAFRGEVEAGRAYLALARQQGLKNDAFDTLEQAKNIILKSLRVSKEINYPNLEIIASEMMADIYKERIKKVQAYLKVKSRDDFIINIIKRTKDDERKMSSFLKKAGIARKKYNYQTVFTEKYKKEYYKHIT